MPLTMLEAGARRSIKKIGGKEETKRFLESLGFTPGGSVMIVADVGGDVIVSVRESRVALSRELAGKIMV